MPFEVGTKVLMGGTADIYEVRSEYDRRAGTYDLICRSGERYGEWAPSVRGYLLRQKPDFPPRFNTGDEVMFGKAGKVRYRIMSATGRGPFYYDMYTLDGKNQGRWRYCI